MTEIYKKIVDEYWHYEARKRRIKSEIDKLNTQLSTIEDVLIALNDILCTDGNHIYEHFEESEVEK